MDESKTGDPVDVPAESPKIGAKYKQIYNSLRAELDDNTYPIGSKLPSENEMVAQFSASRPTIGRALAQLESENYIQRRAGAGSFVIERTGKRRLTFGLLIPELGMTEIFEPICQGISRACKGEELDLIWGPLIDRNAPYEVQAQRLCDYYLNQNLSGVFFAPLELSKGKDAVNERIIEAFEKAGIAIVTSRTVRSR